MKQLVLKELFLAIGGKFGSPPYVPEIAVIREIQRYYFGVVVLLSIFNGFKAG